MEEEVLKSYGKKIRKENKRRSIRNLIITFSIVFIGFIIYQKIVGGFIPLIHQTKLVKAKIIKVEKYNWGRGVHKFIMTYEFSHEDKIYYGNYDLWKAVDKKGDLIVVKYALNNPKINKVE